MTRLVLALLFALQLFAAEGRELFLAHCAGCHGSNARGTGKAPGLAANPRLAGQSAETLHALIQHGFPDSGMPSFNLPAPQLDALAAYLRDLNAAMHPEQTSAGPLVTWRDPQPGDWLTYNGDPSANRYSALDRIDTANVFALRLKWLFPIPHFGLEVTPLAADGVMYVTGPNQVYAIDALTGAEMWKYSRPQTPRHGGRCRPRYQPRRGHPRRPGLLRYRQRSSDRPRPCHRSLLWEKAMPEEPQHYGGTLAPLVVNDTVIVGVSGADEGIRGFVACYRAATGELRMASLDGSAQAASLDRKPGRAASRLTGGGSTWLTGSYDADTDTLYWPTGNPVSR